MTPLGQADLDWLFSLQRFGVRPGLARVSALLARLGVASPPYEIVLVGGTNGKGSVSAALAAMLTAAGRRAGLFTSPHLTHFAERFQVDGAELQDELLAETLARVRPHAEELEATFFEVVTALGVLAFAKVGVDIAVLEVGLGGRFDATNALEPVLSVITNVALDHTEVLGDTVAAIASEKAGILRANRPAVTGAAGEALEVLQSVGADLWALGREADCSASPLGWDGWDVTLAGPLGTLAFKTPLLGRHGARNAALAALAARRLGVGVRAIQNGAVRTSWPGRLEKLSWNEREMVLDGAHNPAGAQALVEALGELGVKKVPLIFGAAGDKDLAGMAKVLEPLASEVILTRSLLSPRSADPRDLAALFGVPSRVTHSPQEALALLPPGLSVVAGSLYLIGEVRPLLLGEAGEVRERWQ